MHRQIVLLFGAALLGLAHAQQPQLTAPPGPRFTGVPRKPAKRQEREGGRIEIHQIYGAPIGVDTQYLTMDGSTTKWIGVNTEYLTQVTRTSTVDNVETTSVYQEQLAVSTATEASDGVEVGDVTVLIPEALQNELDALIKDAAASCAGAAKLRKRDSMSCMINAFQGAAQNDEALGLINPAEWEDFALDVAQNAPEILGGAVQVLKTQAQKNKLAIMVAAAATAGVWATTEPAAEVAHKFVFGDGLFGQPADDSDGGNDEDEDEPSPTEQPTTSSTGSSCDPSAEVDENSPACDDEDCKGEDEVCQAEGDKKDCPCVPWVEHMFEGFFDKEWSDAQQQILQELEAGLPDVIPPQCFRNTHGDRFDGEPAAEPSAFCHCSSVGDEGPATKGNFPTMSGEGDDACTYTTMPTKTISISLKPKETVVTSCRMESSHSLEPYCTCNDDAMHGSIVTTYLNTETTVCPDATATMTEIDGGTPTEEPSCYPTHGAPHDNPDTDELIKLCKAGKSEFAAVCRSKEDSTGKFDVGCPGRSDVSRDDYPPINYNHYDAFFEKADDAPKDCNYLFGQGGSDNDDEVGARVDALCIPAFEAIKEKCTWNGGEVKSVCGTFKYQSCPNGGVCKPGSPGSHG